MGICN